MSEHAAVSEEKWAEMAKTRDYRRIVAATDEIIEAVQGKSIGEARWVIAGWLSAHYWIGYGTAEVHMREREAEQNHEPAEAQPEPYCAHCGASGPDGSDELPHYSYCQDR